MLNKLKETSYLKFFLFFSFSIFFVRVLLNINLKLPLHFDEAQYWDWAQNLDWGYFSKPPLLAFFIRIITEICGNGENCIRTLSPLFHSFTSFIIFYSVYFLTRNYKNSLFGAIIFLLMPGITFSSFLISTDVPLIFFSSLIALLIIKINNSNRKSTLYFYILGVALALGILSKYAIFYLICSFIFSMIIDKDCRLFFLNNNFLLSILITIIFISPNIIWNVNNEFVTLSHTAANANLAHIKINFFQGLLFILSQGLIFGIFPFLYLSKKSILFNKFNVIQKIFLISFLLPILVIFFLAIFSRANANWAVVGYPFACILLSTLLNFKKNYVREICLLNQFLFSILIISFIFFLPLFKLDPFSNIKHINSLSEIIKNEISIRNNIALMTDDREDYAHLLYYLKNINIKKAKWNGDVKIDDHYELTTSQNDLHGYDILLITRTQPTPIMRSRADSSIKINSFSFNTNKRTKTFNMYILKNWK